MKLPEIMPHSTRHSELQALTAGAGPAPSFGWRLPAEPGPPGKPRLAKAPIPSPSAAAAAVAAPLWEPDGPLAQAQARAAGGCRPARPLPDACAHVALGQVGAGHQGACPCSHHKTCMLLQASGPCMTRNTSRRGCRARMLASLGRRQMAGRRGLGQPLLLLQPGLRHGCHPELQPSASRSASWTKGSW